MTDQTPTDEQVLELAQQIKEDRGIGLLEAMDIAAQKLTPKGEVDCVFELTIELKPRVAKFFRDTFEGHPTLSVNERLAKFIEIELNRIRGAALARTREREAVGKVRIPSAPSTSADRGPMAMSRAAFLDAKG